MAPTKPKSKSHKDKAKNKARAKAAAPLINPRELLVQATTHLEEGDPETAARIARTAYENIGETGRQAGAALTLLGHIYVELGEIDTARSFFLKAVKVDEDGSLPEDVGGGAEKFLWLAQLSEEGGQDSVAWFERGAAVLRRQIQELTDSLDSRPQSRDVQEAAIVDKRRRLADALCAVAEVYMTDLSWEEDAEQRCEALITEATLLAPESPETWRTVANVRISQTRVDEAREALKRNLSLWWDLEPEDPAVPAFPARISLVRLLIEVEMEKEAIEVTDRLVLEDDRSVEALYLGGYAKYLLGEKMKAQAQGKPEDEEAWKALWRSSRKWLTQCLKVFQQEEYEDERLGEHARELKESINSELGAPAEEEEDEWESTDDEEWEGIEDGDEDTEMQ
jgi:tetratricopeptide (TPR) repeat protein